MQLKRLDVNNISTCKSKNCGINVFQYEAFVLLKAHLMNDYFAWSLILTFDTMKNDTDSSIGLSHCIK